MEEAIEVGRKCESPSLENRQPRRRPYSQKGKRCKNLIRLYLDPSSHKSVLAASIRSSACLWCSILSVSMSTYGTLFRVTTYGESHCSSVGAIIDGCPPVTSDPLPSPATISHCTQGLQLTEEDIQVQLSRRRPGQSNLTTPVGK